MTDDLNVALKAARRGAEEVRKFQEQPLDISYKGHNDLVTDADVSAEKVILETIRSEFPDDEVMAEESSEGEPVSDGRIWIVDPIDGTTNFAYRFPVYCVSVGLWQDQKPEAAVVIEVNRNEEFYAWRGGGAWLNGQPISVSDEGDPARALVGTGFPYSYDNDDLFDEYVEMLRELLKEVQGIRRPGAATYDLCCVAAGRFQGFYEFSLKAWDVAAASLIIREAGGTVTDWNGEEDWLYGERMIAGNPEIHRYLLEKIQRVISKKFLTK